MCAISVRGCGAHRWDSPPLPRQHWRLRIQPRARRGCLRTDRPHKRCSHCATHTSRGTAVYHLADDMASRFHSSRRQVAVEAGAAASARARAAAAATNTEQTSKRRHGMRSRLREDARILSRATCRIQHQAEGQTGMPVHSCTCSVAQASPALRTLRESTQA